MSVKVPVWNPKAGLLGSEEPRLSSDFGSHAMAPPLKLKL